MSLFIASLNSGSNGNCYYVGNSIEAVLVDAGISCKETETRLKLLGLDVAKIKAIFITHEHADHINGLTVFSKKYNLPVYITAATLRNSRLKLEKHLVVHFDADQPIAVGNLSVLAFRKFHDAADPHSFVVSGNGIKIGVFTDLGKPCENLIHHFKQCTAAFLESNYDVEMLANGSYPYYLKKRITNGEGHLSNDEALQLFLKHKPAGMRQLLLSHLSKNNNSPKLVQELFAPHAGETNIVIASRDEASPVFEITSAGIPVVKRKLLLKKNEQQLSLF
jgi:phosphoribosyl 1,2-cyclic phosphodiesterase